MLVGPGGVIAVETKWQGRGWDLDPPEDRVLGAARQAARNARDLRMWANLRAAGVTEVTPVVILWGPPVVDKERRPVLDVSTGAQIVPARCLDEWRELVLRADQVLNDAQIQRCWQALAEQARIRDEREPLPTGGSTLVWRAGLGLAGMLASVVMLASAGRVLDSVVGLLLAIVAATGVGAVGGCWTPLRAVSYGWLSGVALVCGGVAVELVRIAIT